MHCDEDMTTLDMTKNIAYMHICQVISSANYSIIYLCYPEQKYFTHFCVLSNCRCMGHLYNPHMKIRKKEMFICCPKSSLTSLLAQEKIESKSLTFWIQIRTAQTYLIKTHTSFSYGLRIGWFFFCWKLDFVHFPTQLESPSNSSGALSCGRNNLMLQQNPSQTTSPKVLHHLHLGPLALYDLDLVLGCLGTPPTSLAATPCSYISRSI